MTATKSPQSWLGKYAVLYVHVAVFDNELAIEYDFQQLIFECLLNVAISSSLKFAIGSLRANVTYYMTLYCLKQPDSNN
jgi:hypothetical protein